MHVRTLGSTDVVTSILGFGCASLFHLPLPSDRRRMLELAFDVGIRHFDVAPMYGLGRAEPELARFLWQRRSEVTVTSKFGIEPTLLGRAAGFAQAPVRAVLRRNEKRQVRWQRAGRGAESGRAGRMLYRGVGYTRATAQAGLARSLRALRTDFLDVFLLHEPTRGLPDPQDLAGFLEQQRVAGRIRAWGTAGESSIHDALLDALPGLQIVQHRDDVLDKSPLLSVGDHRAHISFGVLAQVLAPLRTLFAAQPRSRDDWSQTADCDLRDPDQLVGLLLREAVSRNVSGPVVFSTTRPDRLELAVRAVGRQQSDQERLVVRHLAEALRPAPESGVVR